MAASRAEEGETGRNGKTEKNEGKTQTKKETEVNPGTRVRGDGREADRYHDARWYGV